LFEQCQSLGYAAGDKIRFHSKLRENRPGRFEGEGIVKFLDNGAVAEIDDDPLPLFGSLGGWLRDLPPFKPNLFEAVTSDHPGNFKKWWSCEGECADLAQNFSVVRRRRMLSFRTGEFGKSAWVMRLYADLSPLPGPSGREQCCSGEAYSPSTSTSSS